MALAPAIIVLGPSALPSAARVKEALTGAAIHAPALKNLAVDRTFENAITHLQALFASGTPIVGVCAAGILIRALAPVLRDKQAEPPVLAVTEDGSAVVPLLGGHRGANRLARELAGALGCAPAITTAGEVSLGFALDDPPPGWRLSANSDVKTVTAALLAGDPVSLQVAAGDPAWLRDANARFADDAPLTIQVTDRADASGDVVLQPSVLAVGVGCERGAEAEELIALIDKALEGAVLSPDAVACLATIDLKSDEPAMHAAAAHFGWPLRLHDAAALEAETPRLANPSDIVFQAVGCHGVAEGAALASAGPDAELALPKRRSKRATCAIARAQDVIDPMATGRARGHLSVVGIGPGTAEWRTPAAQSALMAASDIVGYGLYLDLLGPLAAGKTRHEFSLGEEETRVRAALDLAGQGRNVALISSGDAGIYGMAALVFELIDRPPETAWRGIEIEVQPGLSAMMAAAARAGAPLGHDFCAISLSDLMTPWAVIEQRLKAAAEADFVVALYNPASAARKALLPRALEILGATHGDKPVLIARNLGRDGENVTCTTLAALDPATVDMLTLLIVGNAESRLMTAGDGREWLYTPRGYAPNQTPMVKGAS